MTPQTARLPFRRSIRAKLIGLIAVVIAAIVGVLAVYFPLQQIAAARDRQCDRVAMYGQVFAGQLRSAIAFADLETAREVLGALETDGDVVAVALWDANGTEFYARGKSSPWVKDARKGVIAQRVFSYRDRVAVVAPITSLEGPRGTLVIELSQERLLHQQRIIAITAAALASALLALGVIAAWLIARTFVRRLNAIGDVATAIAGGATERAVAIDANDEIGVLGTAFNQMVGRLADANHQLEDRVADRTAQLEDANQQLREELSHRGMMELKLRHAEKLQSVGRLAAGVAHEINTPIQFVGDSVQFISDEIPRLVALIEQQKAVVDAAIAGLPVLELARTAAAACDAADLTFIVRELSVAASQALDGLERVGGIVQTMKVFSHQQSRASSIDLNQAVANTLTLARNEYKYVADVETSYGELPPILCHGGEINQVLLNLVLNAAQAVAEVSAVTKTRGRIAVSTWRDRDMVAIDIRDTGNGVPESIRGRIFEPFFTTKDVGKGTGQGLAIAHSVIARHRGTLTFETATGLGTTFQIRIPIQATSQPMELAA